MTAGTGLRVDQLAGFRIGVTSDRRSERPDLRPGAARGPRAARPGPEDRPERPGRRADLGDPGRDRGPPGGGAGHHRLRHAPLVRGRRRRGPRRRADRRARRGRRSWPAAPRRIGAVRAAGLEDAQASDHETTASMVDALIELPAGRPPGRDPAARLHRRGAAGPAPAGERSAVLDRHAVPLGPADRRRPAAQADRRGLRPAAGRRDLHQRSRRGGDPRGRGRSGAGCPSSSTRSSTMWWRPPSVR